MSHADSAPTLKTKPASADAQVADVWTRYIQTRTTEDRNTLIDHYRWIVEGCAERLHRRLPGSVEVDDLISAGIFGLMEAIDAFEPGRNVTFKTFCSHRVNGAMLDEVRSMDWVPRHSRQLIRQVDEARTSLKKSLGRNPGDEEVAQTMGVSDEEYQHIVVNHQPPHFMSIQHRVSDGEDDIETTGASALADPRSESGLSIAQKRELKEWALRGLSKNEKVILTLYYFEQMTLKEIGLTLELSESRVSQVLKSVISRLKSRAAKDMQKAA